MTLPTPESPTLAPPRITAAKFISLLKTKNSPAVPEGQTVYNILIAQGVDPSFALAQFRVESQYGTAGYAKTTGSWGNMLYDSHLTLLASGQYSPGNGYTYATYNNYVDAITDYCRYIYWYITQYEKDTISEATARWIGKPEGSTGHTSYVNIVISDMIAYEYPEGTWYEVGDKMIYGGAAFDKITGHIVQKYPVTVGMKLYRGTNGDLLKSYTGTPGLAWFLGPVNGSWEWGVIGIGTSAADTDITWVYIKDPDKTKIKTVG
jgi:hypothetical protein